MKKTNYFYLAFILVSCSWMNSSAQNFVQINAEQNGKQVTIAADQVLEVQLPAQPSTGYGWYLRNSNNEITRQAGIVEQVGNWEFTSDNPKNSIGATGKQIIHLIAKEAGNADLHFAYVKPWSQESPLQEYNVSVVSEGAYIGSYKAPAEIKAEEITLSKSSALPAKFSWKDENKLTAVKNQASCGSCWAFAACGQFEANIKRFDNVTRDLSEQWLVNCDKDYDGCGGGMYPGNMFQKYGAVYEADAPYKGKDGTCASSYTYHEKIISFKEIATTPTTSQIKEAIYTYGPVWAGVVAGNNFSAYSSGVFTKSDAGELNHAILLVGWDDATSSWVLRNSWGASWGESGYMRIKYGTCQVGAQGTYMVYKDPATGIDETKAFESIATIYPNPSVDDKLTIQLNRMEDNNATLNVTIHDVQGRVIVKQDAKPNTKMEISTQAFSKGMYFVTVASEAQSANYKIVKQ
jgi:predicted secreted protein